MTERRSLGALGFLAMAFVIVGLVGEFATYAAPLAYRRAMARDAALDAALAVTAAPDPHAALRALAPRLGDSAPALTGGDIASLPARVQAERAAMHARFTEEAEAVAGRLRLLILLVTLTAAAFGIAMASIRSPER